jgi:hypothetical protein
VAVAAVEEAAGEAAAMEAMRAEVRQLRTEVDTLHAQHAAAAVVGAGASTLSLQVLQRSLGELSPSATHAPPTPASQADDAPVSDELQPPTTRIELRAMEAAASFQGADKQVRQFAVLWVT